MSRDQKKEAAKEQGALMRQGAPPPSTTVISQETTNHQQQQPPPLINEQSSVPVPSIINPTPSPWAPQTPVFHEQDDDDDAEELERLKLIEEASSKVLSIQNERHKGIKEAVDLLQQSHADLKSKEMVSLARSERIATLSAKKSRKSRSEASKARSSYFSPGIFSFSETTHQSPNRPRTLEDATNRVTADSFHGIAHMPATDLDDDSNSDSDGSSYNSDVEDPKPAAKTATNHIPAANFHHDSDTDDEDSDGGDVGV